MTNKPAFVYYTGAGKVARTLKPPPADLRGVRKGEYFPKLDPDMDKDGVWRCNSLLVKPSANPYCRRRVRPHKRCEHHLRNPLGRPPVSNRYAKHAATLDAKLTEFHTDPDITSLKSEIAALRALVATRLSALSAGELKEAREVAALEKTLLAVTRAVETFHKIEQTEKGSVTLSQLDFWRRQVSQILLESCGKCHAILDIAKALEAIRI